MSLLRTITLNAKGLYQLMAKYQMFKCDNCGQFISNGEARRVMISPDSDWSYEEWETLCPKCTKMKEFMNNENKRIHNI